MIKSCNNDPIEEFLRQTVEPTEIPKNTDDVHYRLDILERFLEEARFRLRHLNNNLQIEEYYQGTVTISEKGMSYSIPEKRYDLGSGHKPICYQPSLLLFLAIHHKEHRKIYDSIDEFISEIWANLEPLDFKKTQTGVHRCFTNVRFAANVLREYGLLKFTRGEAFKFWKLKLSGFVVGACLLDDIDPWDISLPSLELPSSLHPKVIQAWLKVKKLDDFLEKLNSICEPFQDIFESFEEVVKKSHEFLILYGEYLNNSSIKLSERSKICSALMTRMESVANYKEFYDEFSANLSIEESTIRALKNNNSTDTDNPCP